MRQKERPGQNYRQSKVQKKRNRYTAREKNNQREQERKKECKRDNIRETESVMETNTQHCLAREVKRDRKKEIIIVILIMSWTFLSHFSPFGIHT